LTGVKRRFTRTGEHNGVTVFDDYGHHPVEIAAVLAAARRVTQGKVVAVMQPHRYTRLASLFNEFCSCFNDADTVILAPVYAAGEAARSKGQPMSIWLMASAPTAIAPCCTLMTRSNWPRWCGAW
jgi:UDP-N-acetylmuramate-alanine ligase